MRWLIALLFVSCMPIDSKSIIDEDSHLYTVCMNFCKSKNEDTYGVQARAVKDNVIRCLCRTHRGDTVDYINVKEYESKEDTQVDVLRP